MNYLIISEAAISLKRKRVRVLIEHNNSKRQNSADMGRDADVDAFIQTYWTNLWSEGIVVSDHLWLDHEETQFNALYRTAIRAGIQSAKGSSDLAAVSDAIEDVIAASDKAAHLAKLQSLASNATAAERDRFFLLCAFLFLSKTLGGDG